MRAALGTTSRATPGRHSSGFTDRRQRRDGPRSEKGGIEDTVCQRWRLLEAKGRGSRRDSDGDSEEAAPSSLQQWPSTPDGFFEDVPEQIVDEAPPSTATFENSPETSKGSARHGRGDCKPCAHSWKPGGCYKGTTCPFCHICTQDDFRSRRHTMRKHRVQRQRKREARDVAKGDAAPDLPRARTEESSSPAKGTSSPSLGGSASQGALDGASEPGESPAQASGKSSPRFSSKSSVISLEASSLLGSVSHQESLRVKNTFLHIEQEESEMPRPRSSSMPPMSSLPRSPHSASLSSSWGHLVRPDLH